VLLEAGANLVRFSGLGHLRQRLQDLLFGVVDVLEGVEKQIFKGLFGSHVVFSSQRGGTAPATERPDGGSCRREKMLDSGLEPLSQPDHLPCVLEGPAPFVVVVPVLDDALASGKGLVGA